MDRMTRLFTALTLAVALGAALPAQDGGASKDGMDWASLALSIPVGFKTIAPIGMALRSGGDGAALAVAGAAGLAWTLPGAMLLANAWSGDAAGTRFWRKVSLVVDGLAFAGFLGLGALILAAPAEPGSWNDLAGLATIAFSVPIGVGFGLDWIPWPVERRKDGP